MIGFSKGLALELERKEAGVDIVAPGYIHTPTNAAVAQGMIR